MTRETRPQPEADAPHTPIRIGISSCLLGEAVRWDGNHKHDSYITGTLGRHFTFVPVCPEFAVGLGVPRQPIRLVGSPEAPRAVGTKDDTLDVTDALRTYSREKAGELAGLSGYLLKSKSPSCGMERVKVYPPTGGAPSPRGVGLYAAELMGAHPLLPVEEEGRLGDPVLRENFIARVFAYHRWQRLEAEGLTPARLVAFHNRHKLTLMSHHPKEVYALGRLVADAGKQPIAEVGAAYVHGFMALLRRRATRKGHTNVLHHLAGYLKRALDSTDRWELAEVIDQYRRGLVPLVVPVTLLRHHFRRHPNGYVAGQTYLEPHPQELMLRNSL